MNLHNAEFIRSVTAVADCPKDGLPQIAFAGKSNVGKSSVLNCILQRKNFARVGQKPGKTIHINYFKVDGRAYFVDLPGYGYAKVSNADRDRWDKLINSYFEKDRNNELLIQLLDCRHDPSADDVQMLQFLHYHRIPFVIVLTKADKLKKSQIAETQSRFEKIGLQYGSQKVFLTSSEKGTGMEELKQYLESVLERSQEQQE